ncbi:unnamed protein product [Ranitomeya imitator]|uniref:Glycoside hydrolase family 1 n=1 Tax=Ranitomeya imitator TaxID=111125 RepID=A0ABN9LUK6_9NEOB|nr:unnamed protein product [Ranitomeya imitator]
MRRTKKRSLERFFVPTVRQNTTDPVHDGRDVWPYVAIRRQYKSMGKKRIMQAHLQDPFFAQNDGLRRIKKTQVFPQVLPIFSYFAGLLFAVHGVCACCHYSCGLSLLLLMLYDFRFFKVATFCFDVCFAHSWLSLDELQEVVTGNGFHFTGVDYYNKLIDSLLAMNVTPLVTLYHFDMPQAIEDQGGWYSEKTAEVFEQYAKFCYSTFGDRVKLWITINEPYIVAKLGYEQGLIAPGKEEPGFGAYRSAHNMIKAHAKAWHAYNNFFKEKQKGLVSIALNSDWAEPFDPNCSDDREACERYLKFYLDWFAKPIFVDGDYPAVMKSEISKKSKEGLTTSRLPEFTDGEKNMIKGTADFFCLNYYTTRKVKPISTNQSGPSYDSDMGGEGIKDPQWPIAGVEWLAVVPWGLRRLLAYIKALPYAKPWLPIVQRLQFKTLTMTYKGMHNLSPPYICDMVSRYIRTRNLRSSQDLLLCSPLISSSHIRIQDFSRASPILWNSLPHHIRLLPTIESFKNNLKTHLFQQAYSLQDPQPTEPPHNQLYPLLVYLHPSPADCQYEFIDTKHD